MIVIQLSFDVILVFLLLTLNIFHIFFFVDFEQVDDSWEEALWNMLWYETDFYMDVASD